MAGLRLEPLASHLPLIEVGDGESKTIGRAEHADILSAQNVTDANEFTKLVRDRPFISTFGIEADSLEGYLFPETYALPKDAPASRLIDAMVDRFRDVYSEEMRARAAVQGLSARQVVTLASLVEKETGKPEERPIVAAVYRNRLKIGMPMQADPTIVYALEKDHRYNGNIRREDLSMESPYNTYKYPGLPPGPVASPGKASLEAVLVPSIVPYLYFVSRNDGSHVFAKTLAEHNKNVSRFQVEYFRRQRVEAARARQLARPRLPASKR